MNIGRLWELLFGCPHKNLSRPVSAAREKGDPATESYVVCLDCGREFAYDTKNMSLGAPIQRSADTMARRMQETNRRRRK